MKDRVGSKIQAIRKRRKLTQPQLADRIGRSVDALSNLERGVSLRGKDTKPETQLRKALWKSGLRYRKVSKLLGRPDIVFSGKRLAVFVDGCFWHGCPEHGSVPESNSEFWNRKITRNVDRDAEVNAALVDLGWKVIRVWEHEIKTELQSVVERILLEHHK